MTHTQNTPAQTTATEIKKKPKLDKIELSSDDSFPCSDPPGWIKVHATPEHDEDDQDTDTKKD